MIPAKKSESLANSSFAGLLVAVIFWLGAQATYIPAEIWVADVRTWNPAEPMGSVDWWKSAKLNWMAYSCVPVTILAFGYSVLCAVMSLSCKQRRQDQMNGSRNSQ